MIRTPLVASMLGLCCALPLSGQARGRVVPVIPDQLMALARQHLEFRTVLPGVPQTVNARDAKAAMFEIQGPTGAAVRIEFILPVALTSESPEASLPISFGAGQGFASPTQGTTSGFAFHPQQPLITTLGAGGRLFVRLGGTVRPGLPQPGGLYNAEIMLVVYDIGS